MRQQTAARVCDHNCFECPFPDCIADDMTAEELKESIARDRDTNITPERKKRRAYREANREKIADQQRAYREANREKIADQQRAYREANREKIADQKRAYYEANREKIADQKRAYREARRWAGLSQTAVSEALRISQPAYSQWETGAVPSDSARVFRVIAELAGCTVDTLLEAANGGQAMLVPTGEVKVQ